MWVYGRGSIVNKVASVESIEVIKRSKEGKEKKLSTK